MPPATPPTPPTAGAIGPTAAEPSPSTRQRLTNDCDPDDHRRPRTCRRASARDPRRRRQPTARAQTDRADRCHRGGFLLRRRSLRRWPRAKPSPVGPATDTAGSSANGSSIDLTAPGITVDTPATNDSTPTITSTTNLQRQRAGTVITDNTAAPDITATVAVWNLTPSMSSASPRAATRFRPRPPTPPATRPTPAMPAPST